MATGIPYLFAVAIYGYCPVMDEILAALDAALKDRGLSDAAASKLAVGHPALVKNLRNSRGGTQRINMVQGLQALAEILDLELYFGPRKTSDLGPSPLGFADPRLTPNFKPDQLYLPIPYCRLAGRPEGAGPIAFRQDWFDQLGLSPDNLRFIEIDGQAMSPEIRPGSLALLDESQRQLVDGHIVATWEAGRTNAAKVGPVDANYVALLHTDPARAPLIIPAKNSTGGPRIVGRIVWAGNRFFL